MTKYFVRTTGNDSNDGLSTTSAFETINKAISKAGDKDEVYIAPGTYREILLFNKVNTANSKIKIIGDENGKVFTDTGRGEVVLDGAPDGVTPTLECAMRFETNNVGRYDIRNIKVRRYLSKVVFHDNTTNGIVQGRMKSGAFIRKTATAGCSFAFHNCEFSGGITGANDTGQADTATYSLGCFVLSLNGEKLIFNKCKIEDNNFNNNASITTFASVLYTFGNGLSQVDFKKCTIKNNSGKAFRPTTSTGAGVYAYLFTGGNAGHLGIGFHLDNNLPSALTMSDSVVEINQASQTVAPYYFKIAGKMCDNNSATAQLAMNTNKFEIVRTKIKSVSGSHYLFSGAGDLRVLDSNITSLLSNYLFYPTVKNDSAYEFINSSVESRGTIIYISANNISGQFTKTFFITSTSYDAFNSSLTGAQLCSLVFCDCYFSGGFNQHYLYAGSSSVGYQTANYSFSNCIFNNCGNLFVTNTSYQRLNISNSIFINGTNTFNTQPSNSYGDLYMNRRIGNTTETYGYNTNGVDNSTRPTNPAEIPAVIFQEIENPIEGMLSPKIPIAPIGRGTIQLLLEEGRNYEIRLNAKKSYTGNATKMQFWIDNVIVDGIDVTTTQDIVIPISPSYSGFYDLDIFGDNGAVGYITNTSSTYDFITVDNVQVVEV